MSAATPVRFPKNSDVKFRLTPDDVAQLNRYLCCNFQNKDDIVTHARRMGTINLQGIEITLEPALLKRLESRQQGHDFAAWIKTLVVKQLSDYVGM